MFSEIWFPWALLLWTMAGAALPPTPRRADPRLAISLDCSDWRFVLRVSLDVFATGRPVDAESLHLGAASSPCGFTSKDPDHPVVIFDYGLLDCGSSRILTNQSIVYSNPFYHVPLAGLEGDEAFNYSVECEYPRRGAVSFENDLLPQRVDFSDLLEAVGSFNFSLTIMDEEWQQPRSSATFLLGGAVNLEARVQSGGGGHLPLRLFIDSCIATPGGGGGQGGGAGGGGGGRDLEYALVEQHGCLVDSKSSGAVFLRPEDPSALRLSFQAFAFANSSGSATNEIYLHCDLHVADSQDDYGPAQKTCSFDQAHSEWRMDDDVGLSELCACCEGDCDTQLRRRQRRHAGQLSAGVSTLGRRQRVGVGPVRVRSGALGHVAWAWLRGPSPRAASTHAGSSSTSSTSSATRAVTTLLCCLSAVVVAVSAVSYALSKGLCGPRRSTSAPLAEKWRRLPMSALPCTDLSVAGGGAAGGRVVGGAAVA